MLLGLLASTLIGSSPHLREEPNICTPYVGRVVSPLSFDEVRASLPQVAPQGEYETTASYQSRLAAAAPPSTEPIVLRQTFRRFGMAYSADKSELTIYPSAFGAGEVNFSNVFGYGGLGGSGDNFTGAIGLMVNATVTGTETYAATNGFGAQFQVTRTSRKVDTVWERPGKRGESPFVGIRPYGPVTKLSVSPSVAQDLIESGSSAVMIVPKAPFIRTGRGVIGPTFSSPRERDDAITVMFADIQCSFLLKGSGVVFAAFAVR